MKQLLYQLAHHGDISWLSYHFAEFIAAQSGARLDEPLCLTAARLCEANLEGSVCIDLAASAGRPMFAGAAIAADGTAVAPAVRQWRELLLASDCIGDPEQRTPITLDGNRLYLNRFWHYEQRVAARIDAMLMRGETSAVAVFERLFGDAAGIDEDQKRAVLNAASKPFSVISGGPGSGKTSTVVRILAVMLADDPDCRLALAAPTGKAAARMQDSIRQRVDQLDISDELRNRIRPTAQTLHRLLGYRGQSLIHSAANPLSVDCLVVDEASMIDLKLMYHLLDALPQQARLILLGDRDQLASVAAGSVLGDITGHGHEIGAGNTPAASAVSLLRGNYRFAADSRIGRLADCVNRGLSEDSIALLTAGGAGLKWWQADGETLEAEAMQWICAAYLPIFSCDSAAAALDVYESSRVLCAVNRGPLGVDATGRRISEMLLSRAGLPFSELYHGLPIMITQNHYGLGLYNGDSGILWRGDSGLRACFRGDGDEIRSLSLNRLPAYTPAWASTVHKSQGSEFDSVLLVLPADADSEALSRELLYTAVTRARREFLLQASRTVLSATVGRLTRRYSGLATRLGWPG